MAQADEEALDHEGVRHDLIKDNPHLKKPVMVLLGFFEQAGDSETRDGLMSAAQEKWHAAFGRTPAAVVDILVRRHCLAEQVFIDGKPYEGTLEDAQTDESLADDAQVEVCLALTEKGERLRDAYAPGTTMRELFDERPGYGEVFNAMLWACSAPDGASREDLEAQINELPPLQPNEKGHKTVYPQYFFDALESAGGIEWRDGAWRITEAGRQLL